MPLPDFLKRKKSQQPNLNLVSESLRNKKPELENGKSYPLENVSEELFTFGASSSHDDSSQCFSFDPAVRSNGLAKSFNDVLSNPNALGYFIQFMDSRSAISLVKFCLDVMSFQASADAATTCSTSHNDADVDLNSNDFGNFQSASNSDDVVTVQNTDVMLNHCDNNCDVVHDNQRNNNINFNQSHKVSDTSKCTRRDTISVEENETCPTSPSCESIDSGILVSQSDSASCTIRTSSPLTLNSNNDVTNQINVTSLLNNNDVINNHHMTPEEQIVVNQTKDALSIYQRYVAPESPMEIEFPLDVKHSIVTGICSESGVLDSRCFDSAIEYVKNTVENNFFADFIQSEYNAKHQVDVLSQDGGRNVNILDILENEVLLFHFMEFLENSEGRNFSSLLEFWISANNFRVQGSNLSPNDGDSNYGDVADFLRNDAVAIYEKFVSLQATSPLGFSSGIRSRIEEQICSADGRVNSNCFDEALQLVVRVLHMKYVQKFINSQLFKNYISELMATIASAASTSCSTPGSRLKPGESSTSLNTSEMNVSISAQNTLLATSSTHKKLNNKGGSFERTDPNFLDLCSESDHLWRRKQTTITNIGHVDSLGRYTSHFDAPPDVSSMPSNQPMGSKISRAVRRMMTNADVQKDKEEMAWQMAGMIVRDVTSRASREPEA